MTIRHLLPLAAATAFAQPTVAPSPETVGRARGENVANYNIVQSFETGYRFHTVDGNLSRYRSDVNFGNGIRLLGSNLTVNSKDGHGKWFDEIVLNTQGLGNDPYQYVAGRIQQNKLYRYDFTFRINDYVNPGLTTGTLGGHLLDTRRQMQDHDFTLFPQSAVRFFGGYSRNSQDGAAISSIQLFDSRGDEYPLFVNVKRQQSEYRVGGEVKLSGFKFLAMRGWQRFREEAPARVDALQAGANPTDLNTLTSLRRPETYSGDTPYWRAHLISDKKEWYSIAARFTYAGGRRDFRLDEISRGTDRRGNLNDRQITFGGTGRRPVTTGSLTLSAFTKRKLTVSNHTAFHQIAMDGDGAYSEFNNATLDFTLRRFNYLGLRTFVNSSDVMYRHNRWLGLYGGYQFSTRRIRSRETEKVDNLTDTVAAEQTNTVHAGVAGLRVQPYRNLNVSVDSEIGRADKPFLPLSERKYHAVGGRAQYKAKALTLSAQSKANYNTNSSSLFVHGGRSRFHSLDASYAVRRWLSFDAGYAKQHWDTLTGLAYFAAGRQVSGDQSVYTSNVHTGYLSVRASFQKRVDLTLGFHRVQDAGDGRSAADRVPTGLPAGSSTIAAFRVAQTLPLFYQAPLARLSVRLHDKLRWNLGYQFYHYREDFLTAQNYRANTGYTSVVWSF